MNNRAVFIANSARNDERYQNHVKKITKSVKKIKKENPDNELIQRINPCSVVLLPETDSVPCELIQQFIEQEIAELEGKKPKIKVTIKLGNSIPITISDDTNSCDDDDLDWGSVGDQDSPSSGDDDPRDSKGRKRSDDNYNPHGSRVKKSPKTASSKSSSQAKIEPKLKAEPKEPVAKKPKAKQSSQERIKKTLNAIGRSGGKLPAPKSKSKTIANPSTGYDPKTAASGVRSTLPTFNGSPTKHNNALKSVGLLNQAPSNITIPKKSDRPPEPAKAKEPEVYDVFKAVDYRSPVKKTPAPNVEVKADIKSPPRLHVPETAALDSGFDQLLNRFDEEFEDNDAIVNSDSRDHGSDYDDGADREAHGFEEGDHREVGEDGHMSSHSVQDSKSGSDAKRDNKMVFSLAAGDDDEELDFEESDDEGNFKRNKSHRAKQILTKPRPDPRQSLWNTPSTSSSAVLVSSSLPIPKAVAAPPRLIPIETILSDCNSRGSSDRKLICLFEFEEKKQKLDWKSSKLLEFFKDKATDCMKVAMMPCLEDCLKRIVCKCRSCPELNCSIFYNDFLTNLVDRVNLKSELKNDLRRHLVDLNSIVEDESRGLTLKPKLVKFLMAIAAEPQTDEHVFPCSANISINRSPSSHAAAAVSDTDYRILPRPILHTRHKRPPIATVAASLPPKSQLGFSGMVQQRPAVHVEQRPVRVTGTRTLPPVRDPRLANRHIPDTLDVDGGRLPEEVLRFMAQEEAKKKKLEVPTGDAGMTYGEHKAQKELNQILGELEILTAAPVDGEGSMSAGEISEENQARKRAEMERRQQQAQLFAIADVAPNDPLGLNLFDAPVRAAPSLSSTVLMSAGAMSPETPLSVKTSLPDVQAQNLKPIVFEGTVTFVPDQLRLWEPKRKAYRSIYTDPPPPIRTTDLDKEREIPLEPIEEAPRDPRYLFVPNDVKPPVLAKSWALDARKNSLSEFKATIEDKEEAERVEKEKVALSRVLELNVQRKQTAKRTFPASIGGEDASATKRKKKMRAKLEKSESKKGLSSSSMVERAQRIASKSDVGPGKEAGILSDYEFDASVEVARRKSSKISLTDRLPLKITKSLQPRKLPIAIKPKKSKVVKYFIIRKETNTRVTELSPSDIVPREAAPVSETEQHESPQSHSSVKMECDQNSASMKTMNQDSPQSHIEAADVATTAITDSSISSSDTSSGSSDSDSEAMDKDKKTVIERTCAAIKSQNS